MESNFQIGNSSIRKSKTYQREEKDSYGISLDKNYILKLLIAETKMLKKTFFNN